MIVQVDSAELFIKAKSRGLYTQKIAQYINMQAEAQARQSKTNDVDQARHKLVRLIGAYLIIQATMNDYIAGTLTRS